MITSELEAVVPGHARERGVFAAPIHVAKAAHATAVATAEPISIGVPLGRGMCTDERTLRLTEDGRPVTLQIEVLERWPDGSIKWALADFQHATASGTTYVMSCSDDAAPLPSRRVVAQTREDGVRVDTGAAQFIIGRSAFPFEEVSVEGRTLVTGEDSVLQVEDAQGRVHTARIDRVSIVAAGPVKAVVSMTGALVSGRSEFAHLDARLEFFAGLSSVRLSLTVRNPRRARHPGGFWELGDAGSVLMRSAAIRFRLREPHEAVVLCSPELDAPFKEYGQRLEVYQDSSGGENWMSAAHVNREGRVPNSFRGYRIRDGRIEIEGLRATPHLGLLGRDGGISLTMPRFWQNFPKAIEATGNSVALSLWPSQYGDVHELQGGEQKTHVFTVHFHGAHRGLEALDWARSPSFAASTPEWYSATGVLPFLCPATADSPAHQELVALAIEGDDSFARKREVIDEYGWRHFGEVYADHEAVLQRDGGTFVSHYNNQYDLVGGLATQFLRTGDPQWWTAMDELASHVVDIDIYHTSEDKAAYNGGLFWHTCHHIDAGRSTHRSYPRADGTQGGGPGNEHNYPSGLVLHHMLTGNPQSADAVLSLARWALAMDDGRRTPFALLASGDTGLASSTDTPDYHGPGRGAAYSIQALLDGFRLSGDRRFIEKAEQLIRRCIHPDDDLEARRLTIDVEARWSYTVFLQMLGRYLEYKREAGQIDEIYIYAQASLLHYARWMLDHESPYLEHPERLEFPNETWMAQEVRKSEVFDFAARHVAAGQREPFLRKAEWFWSYAMDSVTGTPTRSLTRPVALMLAHGLLRSHARLHPDEHVTVADTTEREFLSPTPFVPQKQRARRRLLACLAAAAVALVGAASLAVRWLFFLTPPDH